MSKVRSTKMHHNAIYVSINWMWLLGLYSFNEQDSLLNFKPKISTTQEQNIEQSSWSVCVCSFENPEKYVSSTSFGSPATIFLFQFIWQSCQSVNLSSFHPICPQEKNITLVTKRFTSRKRRKSKEEKQNI